MNRTQKHFVPLIVKLFFYTHTQTRKNRQIHTHRHTRTNCLSFLLFVSLSTSRSCSLFLFFDYSKHAPEFKKKTHIHTLVNTHTHRTPNTLLLIFLNAGTRHQITIYHALSLSLSLLVPYFSLFLSLCLARSLTHPPNRYTKIALKYATRLPNRNSQKT